MPTPDKKFEAVLPDGKIIDINPSNASEAIKLMMDNLSPEERARIALKIKSKKEGVGEPTKEEGREDDTEKQLLEIACEKKELEEQIKEDEETIKKLKKRLDEIEEEIKKEISQESNEQSLSVEAKESIAEIEKERTETLSTFTLGEKIDRYNSLGDFQDEITVVEIKPNQIRFEEEKGTKISKNKKYLNADGKNSTIASYRKKNFKEINKEYDEKIESLKNQKSGQESTVSESTKESDIEKLQKEAMNKIIIFTMSGPRSISELEQDTEKKYDFLNLGDGLVAFTTKPEGTVTIYYVGDMNNPTADGFVPAYSLYQNWKDEVTPANEANVEDISKANNQDSKEIFSRLEDAKHKIIEYIKKEKLDEQQETTPQQKSNEEEEKPVEAKETVREKIITTQELKTMVENNLKEALRKNSGVLNELKIKGEGEEIILSMKARVTKFFVDINVTTTGNIINKGDSIELSDYFISSDKLENKVKKALEPQIGNLIPEIKEFFEKEYGAIKKIHIKDGNLVLTLK